MKESITVNLKFTPNPAMNIGHPYEVTKITNAIKAFGRGEQIIRVGDALQESEAQLLVDDGYKVITN